MQLFDHPHPLQVQGKPAEHRNFKSVSLTLTPHILLLLILQKQLFKPFKAYVFGEHSKLNGVSRFQKVLVKFDCLGRISLIMR